MQRWLGLSGSSRVTRMLSEWQLKGDKDAQKMLVGSPSGLEQRPDWTVERKNIGK